MTFLIAFAFMGIFFLSFFALVVKAHHLKLD
jgi:hypothetical protein